MEQERPQNQEKLLIKNKSNKRLFNGSKLAKEKEKTLSLMQM